MEKDEFMRQVHEFMTVIYQKAYEMGGQISGEHGIGYGKKEYLKQFEGELNVNLMREIKKAFDPKFILNPNKII